MGDTTIGASTKPRDWVEYPTGDTGSTNTSLVTNGRIVTEQRDGYSYADYQRERATQTRNDVKLVVEGCGVPVARMMDPTGLLDPALEIAHGGSVADAARTYIRQRFGFERMQTVVETGKEMLGKAKVAVGDLTSSAKLEIAEKTVEGVKVGVECDKSLKDIADGDAERLAHVARNEANEIRQLKLDLDAGLISPTQYDRFVSKMSPASQNMAAGLKNKQFDDTEAKIAKYALGQMKADFSMGTAAAYKLDLHSSADVKARCEKDADFKKAYEGNYEFKVGVDKVVDDYANDRKTWDANKPAAASKK